jgi:hypothetical protein
MISASVPKVHKKQKSSLRGEINEDPQATEARNRFFGLPLGGHYKSNSCLVDHDIYVCRNCSKAPRFCYCDRDDRD